MMQNDSIAPQILADTPSVSSIAAGTGLSATLLIFFENSLASMIPYLFISFVVIMIDLWFGLQAAKTRREEIRWSRAIRRTVGKCFEYFCWSVLASSLSVATGYQIIQTGLMLVVIGIECISVFQNWLTVKKGKKVTVAIPARKKGGEERVMETGHVICSEICVRGEVNANAVRKAVSRDLAMRYPEGGAPEVDIKF